MSSDTAFTNSDFDDAEQQRLEFGDQANMSREIEHTNN